MKKMKGRTGKVPEMTSSSFVGDHLPNDPVLPSQFFSEPEAARGQPEKRLMWAVLEDAIRCYQGEGREPKYGKSQKLIREAKEWIYSEDEHWPFSFGNICRALDVNPDHLRLRLKRWRAKVAIERAA